MRSTPMHRRRAAALALAALMLPLLTGCDDDLGPPPWEAVINSATLYSIAREEFGGLPAAFDFPNRRAVRVEAAGATGNWDVLLDEEGGNLVFKAPGAIGLTSRAGIAEFTDLTFDEVTAAPRDTARYARASPVEIRTDVVYVVRSRQYAGACVNYAKVEAVDVDVAGGIVVFRYVHNPNCGDRALEPSS